MAVLVIIQPQSALTNDIDGMRSISKSQLELKCMDCFVSYKCNCCLLKALTTAGVSGRSHQQYGSCGRIIIRNNAIKDLIQVWLNFIFELNLLSSTLNVHETAYRIARAPPHTFICTTAIRDQTRASDDIASGRKAHKNASTRPPTLGKAPPVLLYSKILIVSRKSTSTEGCN